MSNTEFSVLPLSKSMLHNLGEIGFAKMTSVQSESLPHILQNRDVIAQAKTGSGKTASFGIGVLHKLKVKKFRVQSLILCPTRELADQVAKELRRLAQTIHNVKILTICGGVAFGPQYASLLHGAHIIVGTPGRVLKHLDKGYLSLKHLDTLVLDEADRMLDMGFIEDIDRVIAHSPKERQTLLFSATFPKRIVKLSSAIQNNSIKIETISEEVPNEIQEFFYQIEDAGKIALLVKTTAHHKPKNMLVFCNTKKQAQEVADQLDAAGIEALSIHGDLEQYERTDVLVRFSNHSCSVLVATDVAARGIDIKDLGLVVNYDIPQDEDTYTHRIGRTGRAGMKGLAVTFYTKRQAERMEGYQNGTRMFDDSSSLQDVKNYSMKASHVTLVIEGGKKDKMRPGDILGALTGDAGIEGKQIGKIDIFDRQSYVAVERSMLKKAYAYLKNGKIKGRRFSTWVFDRADVAGLSSVWAKPSNNR